MKILLFTTLSLFIISCEKMLEVDAPNALVSEEVVFSSDITATSAVNGIYGQLMSNTDNFASGVMGALTGLSSDEFQPLTLNDLELMQFHKNELLSTNALVEKVWNSCYKTIYQANSAYESIIKGDKISVATKNQLLGELLFVRAWAHFTLVNLFGEVPLVTTSNYDVNKSIGKSTVVVIYDQVKKDLLEAQSLLTDNYPVAERVRPNRAVVTTLLARVYLYLEDWENAEAAATTIIDDPRYVLETDLSLAFLNTSTEAIWQLRPVSLTYNTFEAGYYVAGSGTAVVKLDSTVINAFEPGDLRRLNWVAETGSGADVVLSPYKYKITYGGPGSSPAVPVTEYSMVFRVAEQYLIRAEARAMQNKVAGASGAENDMNKIRDRAGLDDLINLSPSQMIEAIRKERQVELFSEWGHRWFDLKRWNLANTVLGPIKDGWSADDMLYPIPQIELDRNPNL